MSHKTVVCACGRRISTCRCASPNKTVVVSDKPCTHGPALVPTWTSERTLRFVGSISAADLRSFLVDLPDTTEVRVSQDPRTGNPTDPGGTVTLTAEEQR